MTDPTAPGASVLPSPPAPESITFPLGWLLSNAAVPIQYRASLEVARIPVGEQSGFASLPYTFRPAVLLALTQASDGTWGNGMLSVPSSRAERFQGIGTITAVRRLVEWGWSKESPPIAQARRTMFRLLAQDDDPNYLFELAPRGRPDREVVRHGREVLREAAAAALSQAGYEQDPRLRGAARRMLERVDRYLRSPQHEKPFVRVGNSHVLAPGSAPPSIYFLAMLAEMPHFRSEHYDAMERLYAHLTQPQPRSDAASVVAGKVVLEPHLVLGDPLPHRTAADADLPATLYWLELFARLGILQRNEGWSRLYERLLEDCDAEGVWRMPKRSVTTRSSNPFVWPGFPLDPRGTADALSADVTFRLGLIGRYSGRPVDVG